MTIEDLAGTLPNGFHDSEVEVMSVDFNARTAEFTLLVWVGTMQSPPGPDRDKYRRARLTLIGLEYLAIEPPHPDYPYEDAGTIKIDLCDPGHAVAQPRVRPNNLPADFS